MVNKIILKFIFISLLFFSPAKSETIIGKDTDNLDGNNLHCEFKEIMFGQHLRNWQILIQFKDYTISNHTTLSGGKSKIYNFKSIVHVLKDDILDESPSRKNFFSEENTYNNSVDRIWLIRPDNHNYKIKEIYEISINRQNLEVTERKTSNQKYIGICEIEDKQTIEQLIDKFRQIPNDYKNKLKEKEKMREKDLKKKQIL